MKQLQSLSHTVWECKYHIVWIPKYRKKVLYGKIREELVGVFHELSQPPRLQDIGRAPVCGSCAHVTVDST